MCYSCSATQRRRWHVPTATRRPHMAALSRAPTTCGVSRAPACHRAQAHPHRQRLTRLLRRRRHHPRRKQASAPHHRRRSGTEFTQSRISSATLKRLWHAPMATLRPPTAAPSHARTTYGVKQAAAQRQGHRRRLSTHSFRRRRRRPPQRKASARWQHRRSRTGFTR